MAKKKNISPEQRAKNLKQQENKTPELAAAKKAFEQYFKDNGLDLTKDYTKDKVHGKKVSKLLLKLNKERDKVAAMYPESDKKGAMKRIAATAAKRAKREEKVDKLQKKLIKEGGKDKLIKDIEELDNKGKKKARAPRANLKYDYPLIEGREMTPDEKKKYRSEQRKILAKSQDNTIKESPKVNKKEKANTNGTEIKKAKKKSIKKIED